MTSEAQSKLSIVIPMYNAEKYIRRTIESVLEQDFDDFILIVVDDGSSDSSLEIAQSIDDDRVTVLSQPPSGGPAKPRNVGVSSSTSEYIAIFDSDDIMCPRKLSESVAILDECKDAGFLISDFGRIDEDDNVILDSFLAPHAAFQEIVASAEDGKPYIFLPAATAFSTLCIENYVGTSSVVIRRAALESLGGFDESLRNCDDWDMWFRLARRYGIAYTPRRLHYYRARSGNISSRGPVANSAAKIKVLRRHLALSQSPTDRKNLRKWIGRNYAGRGYQQRELGDNLASVSSFLSAFVADSNSRHLLAAVISGLRSIRLGASSHDSRLS